MTWTNYPLAAELMQRVAIAACRRGVDFLAVRLSPAQSDAFFPAPAGQADWQGWIAAVRIGQGVHLAFMRTASGEPKPTADKAIRQMQAVGEARRLDRICSDRS